MKQRINYNVPKEFLLPIQVITEQKGIEISFWLRKAIEKAIQEENLV